MGGSRRRVWRNNSDFEIAETAGRITEGLRHDDGLDCREEVVLERRVRRSKSDWEFEAAEIGEDERGGEVNIGRSNYECLQD